MSDVDWAKVGPGLLAAAQEEARCLAHLHDELIGRLEGDAARKAFPVLSRAITRLREALDALPTEAPGEMVEVRAAVLMHRGDVFPVSIGEMGAYEGTHIATITARVPLPRVPVVVATVEPAP